MISATASKVCLGTTAPQFRRRLRSEAALIPESMRSGRGTETAAEVPVKHASGPDSAASGQEEANSTETSASSKQNQCQRTSDMMERHDYVFGELLRTAIQSSGLLDDILDNSGIEFTLFAPTTNVSIPRHFTPDPFHEPGIAIIKPA